MTHMEPSCDQKVLHQTKKPDDSFAPSWHTHVLNAFWQLLLLCSK